MTKDEAMKLALEALEKDPAPLNAINNAKCFLYSALEKPDHFARLVRIMGRFDLSTGHADNWNDLLDSLESELRDVLGYYRETFKVEQECSTHQDAPHGFNRDASHNYGRYVCDCEGWEPLNVSQEPQTMPKKTDDVAQETQPEHEPVAWFETEKFRQLSNEEIDEIASQLDDTTIGWGIHDFARAIEDEIRAKNGL